MALDYVRLRRAANQSISAGVEAIVSWDTEDEDLLGYWTSGDPTKVTVPTGKAGKFIACFFVNHASGTTGRNTVWLVHRNSSDANVVVYEQSVGV